jgi:hypothetical protein
MAIVTVSPAQYAATRTAVDTAKHALSTATFTLRGPDVDAPHTRAQVVTHAEKAFDALFGMPTLSRAPDAVRTPFNEARGHAADALAAIRAASTLRDPAIPAHMDAAHRSATAGVIELTKHYTSGVPPMTTPPDARDIVPPRMPGEPWGPVGIEP